MEESIYHELLKYVDEKKTTCDFYIGKPGKVIYFCGKRIEEKVPDVKENNDLEEIREDINRMPVSFAVRNAEAVFQRGGIHTEEHEEEIESWNDLDQKALPVFVEEILKTADDLQLLAFALLLGSHMEKPSEELLKMYELFAAQQDTGCYALPLLRK